jgi:outer membrane protein TolC
VHIFIRLTAVVLAIGWVRPANLMAATPTTVDSPAPRAVPVVRHPTSSAKPVYYTLRSYIKAVLDQDPGLIGARLAQMSAQDEAKSTRASYLPDLRLHGDLGVLSGSTTFQLFTSGTKSVTVRIPASGDTPASKETVSVPIQFKTVNFAGFAIYGPTVTMPFFKDGSFLGINTPPAVNVKKAEISYLAAKARLDAQDMAYRATDVFLRAVSFSNRARILREHLDYIQKQTDIAHEQAKYGLISAVDLAVVDKKLQENRLETMIAGERAIDAFFRAAELVGAENPGLVRIDTKYPEVQPLPTFNGMTLQTNDHHPLLDQQVAEVDRAKADLALKRSQLWPTGTLESSYRWGNDLAQLGLEDRWLSILSLSAPIFDFGDRYYAAKAADEKLKEERENIAKVHEAVHQNIFDAFYRAQGALQDQAANEVAVAERQRTVDRLEELAKYGRAPIPALIVAHLDLLQAQRDQDQAHLAVLLSSADLERESAGEWKWMH